MQLSSAVRRAGAAATAVAAGTLFAFAGTANAATYTPADTAALEAAVAAANASVGVTDLIQLTSGVAYTPTATLSVRLEDLAIWDTASSSFVLEPIPHTVTIGSVTAPLPLP